MAFNPKTFNLGGQVNIINKWRAIGRAFEITPENLNPAHEALLMPIGSVHKDAVNRRHLFHRVRAAMRAQPGFETADIDPIVIQIVPHRHNEEDGWALRFVDRNLEQDKWDLTLYAEDGTPL